MSILGNVPDRQSAIDNTSDGTVERRAVRGVAWVALAKISRHVLLFVVDLILARRLFPEDFGLLREVLLFTGLAVLAGDLGFSASLIQRRKIDDDDPSSCFWSQLAAGGAITAVLFLFAGPISEIFERPETLRPLIALGSLSVVLTAVGGVPMALLSRRMEFRKLVVPELGATILGGACGIALAYGGFGASSLVWQQVVAAGASSALALAVVRWVPTFSFRWERLRSLFRFGKNILGYQSVDYLGTNLDYFLIALFLDDAKLGAYYRVFWLVTLPQLGLGSIIARVALPAFSRVQDDDERIRRGFLLMTKLMVLVSVPVLVIMAALPRDLIYGLYTAKWQEAVVPLGVLAWMGIINMAVSQPGMVWIAKGRPDIRFKWSILMTVTLLIATLAGVRWGLVGICIALTLRSLVFFPVPPFITGRLIGLRQSDYYAVLLPSAVAGVTVYGGLWLLRSHILQGFSHLPRLGILSSLGILLYMVLVCLMQPRLPGELWGLGRTLWSGKKPG